MGEPLTEPFRVTTGVRQDCLLSPLLFLVVLDWVSKTAFNRPRGTQWGMIQRLEDLDFADDICMLSHRLQDANNQMERLNTTAQRAGLKIHPVKLK